MPGSRWQEVMDGQDYRIAATWAVIINAGEADASARTVFIWMDSTWPDRPAMALLQVGLGLWVGIRVDAVPHSCSSCLTAVSRLTPR